MEGGVWRVEGGRGKGKREEGRRSRQRGKRESGRVGVEKERTTDNGMP